MTTKRFYTINTGKRDEVVLKPYVIFKTWYSEYDYPNKMEEFMTYAKPIMEENIGVSAILQFGEDIPGDVNYTWQLEHRIV